MLRNSSRLASDQATNLGMVSVSPQYPHAVKADDCAAAARKLYRVGFKIAATDWEAASDVLAGQTFASAMLFMRRLEFALDEEGVAELRQRRDAFERFDPSATR